MFVIRPIRTDQLDPALFEPQPKRIAITGRVVDELSPHRSRAAGAGSKNGYLLERRLDVRDFHRRRWRNTNSQSSGPAVCEYHELCASSTFGFAHVAAPYFAGENVPSLTILLHDRIPSSSSSPKNRLHCSSPDNCFLPFLESPPTRRGGMVRCWQILPPCAAGTHPEYALEAATILDPLLPNLFPRLQVRNEWLNL